MAFWDARAKELIERCEQQGGLSREDGEALIREGGQMPGLTNAFVTKLTIPVTEAGRRIISAAITAGECAPLDVAVVQKMVDAPLMHVLVDRTLFGAAGMSAAQVNPYIDHSFGALKTLLCNGKAA